MACCVRGVQNRQSFLLTRVINLSGFVMTQLKGLEIEHFDGSLYFITHLLMC